MNYYRRYMGDYSAKTAALSLAEHGAYNVLLDTCYSTEQPLPGEIEALCRICRAMTKLEQEAVKSVADRFFPVNGDGRRHNPRADREIAKAQATIEKQRESGVESAARRWSTDRSTHESTGESAIQPPTTNLQPLTSNPEPPVKKPARKRAIPANFQISERVKTWAAEKGVVNLQAYFEFFVSKAKAKGYTYADWDEAFMGSVRDDWPKWREHSPPGKVCARCGGSLSAGHTQRREGLICNTCEAAS